MTTFIMWDAMVKVGSTSILQMWQMFRTQLQVPSFYLIQSIHCPSNLKTNIGFSQLPTIISQNLIHVWVAHIPPKPYTY